MSLIIDPDVRKFIMKKSLEERKALSQNILNKYWERVPIIVGRAELKNTPAISKHKFLIPANSTFNKVVHELRKSIPNLNESVSLFFFLNNNMLIPGSAPISFLYQKYRAEDGFLYITYSSENTFG